MATYRNNTEGTTAGTTVATGQTGSGDAFTIVDSATGTGTITYSNAKAAHGKQSIAVTGISGASRYAGWNGDNVASCAVRVYMYLNAYPAATTDTVSIRAVGAGGTCKLQINASGTLLLVPASGGAYYTSASVLLLNTWHRLEMQETKGTTTSNGIVACQYYYGDSQTAIGSGGSSAANTGTINYIGPRIGKITTTGSTMDAYFDDYAWVGGSATPIGPAVQGQFFS